MEALETVGGGLDSTLAGFAAAGGALAEAGAGLGAALAVGFSALAGALPTAAAVFLLAALAGAADLGGATPAAGLPAFLAGAAGAAVLAAAVGLTDCAFTCCLLAELAGGGSPLCATGFWSARDCSG